ncbi:MAG TPA: DUF2442 domain-containing protein [Candidatus Acidoferrum sp.]|nr:DUF2442 domain-containing protein [Candidatus Acidoferrum sp.]
MRDEFDAANERGKSLRGEIPRAIEAHYDRRTGRVVIRLSSGLEVAFAPGMAQGLENANAGQLGEIEVSPSGFGIHFPKLDADLYLPALLEGVFGSRRWMAARLGAAGGGSKSRAKRQAAKRNGRLGGRPKKAVGKG